MAPRISKLIVGTWQLPPSIDLGSMKIELRKDGTFVQTSKTFIEDKVAKAPKTIDETVVAGTYEVSKRRVILHLDAIVSKDAAGHISAFTRTITDEGSPYV